MEYITRLYPDLHRDRFIYWDFRTIHITWSKGNHHFTGVNKMSRITILIADDESEIADLIELHLKA